MQQYYAVKCTDKKGCAFEIGGVSTDLRADLIEMYDNFSPKAVTQGLPPLEKRLRDQWVDNLLSIGENFGVWKDGKMIGHASLIIDPVRNDGEYLIFVYEEHRNKGLGTALTKMVVDKAGELGLDSIWLTVEALNFRAINLYKKIGFDFCDSGERERTMCLRL
jgi:RimJ/RimL family protein N-acetyltransferase